MSRPVSSPAVPGLIMSSLAALLISSCGSSSSSPVAASTPPPVVATPTPTPAPTPAPMPMPTPSAMTITIEGINGNMSFSPNPVNLRVGQQVVFHNADSITHTATQDGGGFNTGTIGPGATSAPITLSAPGTIGYHCTIHPSMVGTLTVTP